MKFDKSILDIDLAHFDGGEGGGAAGAEGGAEGAAPAGGEAATGEPGTPDPAAQDDAEARKAEYAKIKEQYKDLFGEEVKHHVETRLKKFKPLEQQYNAITNDVAELLELTGTKTLEEAKEVLRKQHEKQIEDEAYEKGMEPDDYRKQLQMQRDAERYQQIQQREQYTQKMMQTWHAQAQELAQTYKDFNLQAVSSNPQVQEMLRLGHTMKAAFETVNAAQILAANPEYEGFDFNSWQPNGAFTALLENGFEIKNAFEATNLDWTKQAEAKKAEKRTVDTIKGGGRPREMGGNNPSGGARSKGIENMTPKEAKAAMDEILSGRASPRDYGL